MSTTLKDFLQTVAALRDPESGCPWDLEQTHASLRPYLLEEAHEVIEAIDHNDDAAFCDELGDLLLQVVLHAQLAKERNAFTIADVITAVNDKMIRRHPHVFGDTKADSAATVLKNWEAIKSQEKPKASDESYEQTKRLQGIPRSLPSLTRAQRIGEKAQSVGFDWQQCRDVLAKVKEEIAELEEQIAQTPKATSDEERRLLEHELGDALFAITQLARWLQINAEDSLRVCCDRFISRFQYVEANIDSAFSSQSLEELERLWQEAKRSEKEKQKS